MAQHDQELDADEQHPNAHAGLERNGVTGVRLATKACERCPGIGKCVDPNAEPRNAIASRYTDQAEKQDCCDLDSLEVEQHTEVQQNHKPDEELEYQMNFPAYQVGLAVFVDQSENLQLLACTGIRLTLPVSHESEQQAESAYDSPVMKEWRTRHTEKLNCARSGITRIRFDRPVGGPALSLWGSCALANGATMVTAMVASMIRGSQRKTFYGLLEPTRLIWNP